MAKPGRNSVTVTFSLSKEDAEWLKDHAWMTRRSSSKVLREIVQAFRKEVDNPHMRRLVQEAAIAGRTVEEPTT